MFTQDECVKLEANNQKNIESLKEILSKELNNKLLFVGAGISKAAGYKTWIELLDELEEEVKYLDDKYRTDTVSKKKNPLVFAQKMKDKIVESKGKERYYRIITNEFEKDKDPKDMHKDLISLNVKGIITTNYDDLIEKTIKIENNVSEDISSFIPFGDFYHKSIAKYINKFREVNKIVNVLHLHGKSSEPNSIILSLDEYQEAYGFEIDTNTGENPKTTLNKIFQGWTIHSRILWSLLAFHHIIFIGFSLVDPFINWVLETISKDFWGWDKSVHFAILSYNSKGNEDIYSVIKQKELKLKKELGIEVIWYDSSINNHSILNDIINNLITEKESINIKDNVGDEGART